MSVKSRVVCPHPDTEYNPHSCEDLGIKVQLGEDFGWRWFCSRCVQKIIANLKRRARRPK